MPDFRGSKGAIYKPKGPVDQQFGDRNYYINIPKAEEISRLPTIPDPPSDFTGRDDELKELQAKLEGGINIIGLRGIGGVGKTALAFKLTGLLKDRYPDGQVMVDMRGTTDPISPIEAMRRVIHAYYPDERIPDTEAEVRDMYRRTLEGKRALILLDNSLDDKQALSLIPPKSCGLLLTSRKTIKLPGLFRKDLYALKLDEALELLLNICCQTTGLKKCSRDDPAWTEIARLCGYLPLALRAAASLLANTEDLRPARYAKELKDERTRLERIGEEGVELGVDACFNLSFQRLDSETRQAFLNVSVFPADFDGQDEEQICQDEGHKRLSELARWSLVDYRPEGPDYGLYKVHELARLFASARQSAGSRLIIQERHAAYFKDLLFAANSLYLEGGQGILSGLALFDLEWANIQAGQSWAESQMSQSKVISKESESAVLLSEDYPNAGAHVLDLRLHPLEKIRWREVALAASRQLKDKAAEGVHLSNLGSAYADLGEPHKAIEYYEQALKISREIGNRRGEGADIGNLGLAYYTLGEHRKAIERYDQALNIAREIGDRRNEGIWLGDLGIVYASLGEYLMAIEYYYQALKIAREIENRGGEGASLGNLGIAYASLCDPRKAIEYYEQALKISREIGDRRSEGASLDNLGLAYAALDDPHKAIECHYQALDIAQEIGNCNDEGNALFNASLVLETLGEMKKAIDFAVGALSIFEQIESSNAEIVRKQLAIWEETK